ncbi:MAG: 4-(cytidine 5'-diphospho)-2-C-methyl-D-erythritol kinase [Opitutaceae bacterium]|nr:4-(cytidine 5'-diphospho)-2-C-methyl-D-erythritol kinase [Verrucomicrobiales bacterium]
MSSTVEKTSPCKVNLILNILGRRSDGYHELETIMQPVPLHDTLRYEKAGSSGVHLTCSDPTLPVDSSNLVYKAANRFLKASGRLDGIKIHLEKRLPMAAGLGGGSGNAGTTLLALNELFGHPLNVHQLQAVAAGIGSDVPFFLQDRPALATGRGEVVAALPRFPALQGAWLLLVHPGFGISTPWAYQQLAQHPEALNGRPGRARHLANLLQGPDLSAAAGQFYNSLEAPALLKFPLLALFQQFFREHGAAGTLMSGSGSTTFALASDRLAAERLLEKFLEHFGQGFWTAIVAL